MKFLGKYLPAALSGSMIASYLSPTHSLPLLKYGSSVIAGKHEEFVSDVREMQVAQRQACSCNPQIYGWKIYLNNNPCNNIYESTGVKAVHCHKTPATSNATPTVLTDLSFYEIYEDANGQERQRVASQSNVSYTSGVTIADRSIVDQQDVLVKGYRIEAIAVAGTEIQELEVTIYFSNECTGTQSIGINDAFGWFDFAPSYSSAMNPEYCPAAGTPSSSPSPAPTIPPVGLPTISPSKGPTSIPSVGPTINPTPVPRNYCLDLDITGCSFGFNGTSVGCDLWTEEEHSCFHNVTIDYKIENAQRDEFPVMIVGGHGPFDNVDFEEFDDNSVEYPNSTTGMKLLFQRFNKSEPLIERNHTIHGLNLCTLKKDIGIYIENSTSFQDDFPVTIDCKSVNSTITIPSPSPAPTPPPSLPDPPLTGAPSTGGNGNGKGNGKGTKSCKSSSKGKGSKNGSDYVYEYTCGGVTACGGPGKGKGKGNAKSSKAPKAGKGGKGVKGEGQLVNPESVSISPSVAKATKTPKLARSLRRLANETQQPQASPTSSPITSPSPQLCACNPTFYAWELHLERDCTDLEYITAGIDSVSCDISGDDGESVVTIRSIRTLELSENFEGPPIYSDIQPNVNLVDSALYSVPSITGGGDGLAPIPRGHRIIAVGETANGNSRTMTITIHFTNVCELESVFVQGNKFGWFEFNANESEPSSDKYCNLHSSAPSTIDSPNRAPSFPPSATSIPTSVPFSSTKSSKGKGKGRSKGSALPSLSPTGADDGLSQTCDQCFDLMSNEISEPEGSERKTIHYAVEILTKNAQDVVPNEEVEDMLLEAMNGYFKAQLIGCNIDSRRRFMIDVESIDLHAADFDHLKIGGKAAQGLCNNGEADEICRGAEGRLTISYFEDDIDEDANTEITKAVTDLLEDNADAIIDLVDEIEGLRFPRVSHSRNDILPSRPPILKTGWMIAPFVAGCMLLIYGTFIMVRDRRKRNLPNSKYKHLEIDEMNDGLFDENDNLRSDSMVAFPIPSKKWNDISVPNEDDNFLGDDEVLFNRQASVDDEFAMPAAYVVEDRDIDLREMDDDAFNREALARSEFMIPTVEDYDDEVEHPNEEVEHLNVGVTNVSL